MKLYRIRYLIVGLLFLAAVLNYVDKNTFALLAPTIQKDLNLSDQGYANVQNVFQGAYLIASLTAGLLVDRFGPRFSMALFVGWWSIANMLTALARTTMSFGAFRLMLGLGEAGNWMGSPKAVAEWFPAKERGLAIGIYTAGTPVGMTVAPLVIIGLASVYGWRSTFFVTGLLGLFWLLPWLLFYRGAKENPLAANTEEAGVVCNLAAKEVIAVSEPGWNWLQAFGRTEIWCLIIARMFSDPIWFFYQNWYPKYLVTARGFTQIQIKSVWVIFMAAGLGCLAGGWLAGRFIKRGSIPERARLNVMLGCAAFMPLSPLVAIVPSVTESLALASLMVFMHLAWLTNLTALVVEVVPPASLGAVAGIVAAGGSAGAIVMNSLVAWLLKNYSYTNWFWIAGALHLAVIPLLFWGVLHKTKRPRASTI